MKKPYRAVLAAAVACVVSGTALAGNVWVEKINQVTFRGGLGLLSKSRGNEIFTDTLNATAAGLNDGKMGYTVGAALDLGITPPGAIKDMMSLSGEISVEYAKLSNKAVLQPASTLVNSAVAGVLTAGSVTKVPVTELNVSISPKLHFDSLGHFRPFVIPVGLSFLVNSPPSNNTGYLDLGVTTGAGFDVRPVQWLSLGADVRYTYGFKLSNTNTSYLSTAARVGLAF